MGILDLFAGAFVPSLQVLLVATLGAFLASDRCALLPPAARRSLSKLVFYVFTPCLVFADIAEAVTLQDMLSWWFMPVNIGITFFFGSALGWLLVKIFRPERHLQGLVVAFCSCGNLGNLMVVIVPAVCNDNGGPFGNPSTCRPLGLSYASFSMALGGFYLWTHTYSLMKRAGAALHRDGDAAETEEAAAWSWIWIWQRKSSPVGDGDPSSAGSSSVPLIASRKQDEAHGRRWWRELPAHRVAKELMQPPACAALAGLAVGVIPRAKSLLIGRGAPFGVLQDSVKLLGDGTIPSVLLVLGGNLAKGLGKSGLGAAMVAAVMGVRYVALPLVGIGVVKGASALGLLPPDPLFSYVLMTQFTMPPATNIGTLAEMFDVGQEECSCLFLWTYTVAAVALTLWSTVYMWLLSP